MKRCFLNVVICDVATPTDLKHYAIKKTSKALLLIPYLL